MDFSKIPEHQVTTIGAEERRLRRRRLGLIAAVVAVGLAGAAWAFSEWRSEQSAAGEAILAAQAVLAGRVGQLEKRYRVLTAEGRVNAEALAALDEAIKAERERQQLGGRTNREEQRFLEGLERERDDWLGRAALPRLASLEAAAQAMRDAGDTTAAVENLRQALALQRAINGGSAAAAVKDYVRETRLAQALVVAEVEPLRSAVQTALGRAKAGEAAQDWLAVRVAYTEARTAQIALNQKYPGTRFADTQALNRIESELASLQAADGEGEVRRQTARAEAAVAAGRAEEAGAAYTAARDAQAKLNRDFARSRFASAAALEELEGKRETLLAAKELAALNAKTEAIAAALRSRQVTETTALVAAATEAAERLRRDWPRSARSLDGLGLRLAYLSLRGADLGAIQDEVSGRLESLPKGRGRRMLATEVSQELYLRVMNTNPSRNPGRSQPVDSVSWRDAQEFCERLGWIMGRRVRLPTEAEWRAAAGADTGRENWTKETSGGRSRDVGKAAANHAGFFDLFGNVAEWLEPGEAKSAVAPVAGGSFLDGVADIAARPIERMDKGERLRQVGFRLVVDMGDQAETAR